jgi:hypothetical protein
VLEQWNCVALAILLLKPSCWPASRKRRDLTANQRPRARHYG